MILKTHDTDTFPFLMFEVRYQSKKTTLRDFFVQVRCDKETTTIGKPFVSFLSHVIAVKIQEQFLFRVRFRLM